MTLICAVALWLIDEEMAKILFPEKKAHPSAPAM
jgi:hypothetical protein